MSGASTDQNKALIGSVPLTFSGALPGPIELTPIYRGMRGEPGEKGDIGDPADIGDMPDLSLIFDNQLI